MARITVEDCLDKVSNRFSLVLVSAERTKQLLRGADSMVDNDEANKEVVLALREIAAGKFDVDESEVIAHDEHMPTDRRRVAAAPAALPPAVDDDLPPPPAFDDDLPAEA
jgi:DNA-directed RNA polymerase subunit omega